jgi:hypothetical protein
VHLEALVTQVCAGTHELGVGSFPDFDQAQATSSVIAQARIIAESGNFEAVKFTSVTDGPTFFCLNLQVVYEHLDHDYLTSP